MNKTYRYFGKAFTLIFCVIITYSLFALVEYCFTDSTLWHWQTFLMLILMFVVIAAALKTSVIIVEKNEKLYMAILLVACACIYVAWGAYVRTPLLSDYEVLYNGAKDIVNGTFYSQSTDVTNYFYIYNGQVGYTSFLALLIKIFGDRLAFIKVIEIAQQTVAILLLYFIVKILFDKKMAAVSATLYLLLVFNIAGSNIINNQHTAMVFILAGILLFLQEKTLCYILSGVSLAIAVFMRQSAMIIVIAVIIVLLMRLVFKSKNKKEFINKIKHTAFVIIAYFAIINLMAYSLIWAGITNNLTHKSNIPYFKYVLGIVNSNGLDSETTSIDARHTNIYYDLVLYGFDYDRYNEDSKQAITSVLKHPDVVVLNAFRNTKLFMGHADNQINFSGMENQLLKARLTVMGQFEYLALLFIALAYAVKKMRSKDRTLNELLFVLIFLGFFAAHMFMESQPRYRYEIYMVLTVFASSILMPGVDRVWFAGLKKWIAEKRNTKKAQPEKQE